VNLLELMGPDFVIVVHHGGGVEALERHKLESTDAPVAWRVGELELSASSWWTARERAARELGVPVFGLDPVRV